MCAMVVEVGPEIEQLVLEICSCPEERLIQILASNGAVFLRFPLSERTPHNGSRSKMPFQERMRMSGQLRRMAMTFASNTFVPSALPARVPAGFLLPELG